MFIAAAAALAASASPPPPTRASYSVQARATVRIVQATRLRVGSDRSEEGKPVLLATIRTADGRREAAKLVEFE